MTRRRAGYSHLTSANNGLVAELSGRHCDRPAMQCLVLMLIDTEPSTDTQSIGYNRSVVAEAPSGERGQTTTLPGKYTVVITSTPFPLSGPIAGAVAGHAGHWPDRDVSLRPYISAQITLGLS